ncbi:MAG: acyl carrier protein [Myxococcota bacterium]
MGETAVEVLSEKLRGLMAEQLGVEPGEIKPDSNILEDLGADSLDVVEMVMAIEDAFDIEIEDSDAEAMRTVADIEAYVAKRLS